MWMTTCTIWEICNSSGRCRNLQKAAEDALEWSRENLTRANIDKTEELLVDFARQKSQIPRITIDGMDIERVAYSPSGSLESLSLQTCHRTTMSIMFTTKHHERLIP